MPKSISCRKSSAITKSNAPISAVPIVKTRCVPENNKSMSAYYQLPDRLNKTKGTFFVNALDLSKINKDEMLVLSVHEGIPGHHYEYLYHLRNNKSIYMTSTGYTTFSEGWALYCESFTQPNNIREEFWKLIYSLHRAIRLTIDTGIHWYGWSFEKCFLEMKTYLPFTDQMIRDEILRYIDDPGQALCYTIGALTFFDLREKFLKKNNNIQLFHELVLDIGPCHLDLLIEEFHKHI